METIIKKAIKGGWGGMEEKYVKLFSHFSQKTQVDNFKTFSCDPLFWQAIGKACGWGIKKVEMIVPARYTMRKGKKIQWKSNKRTRIYFNKKVWAKNALHFHEINLTEGWEPAIKYLTSLLPEVK